MDDSVLAKLVVTVVVLIALTIWLKLPNRYFGHSQVGRVKNVGKSIAAISMHAYSARAGLAVDGSAGTKLARVTAIPVLEPFGFEGGRVLYCQPLRLCL
jgi:hypothetical protein